MSAAGARRAKSGKLVSIESKLSNLETVVENSQNSLSVYFIDTANRFVSVRFTKRLIFGDIEHYVSALCADPRFDPAFSEIVDLREVKEVPSAPRNFLPWLIASTPFTARPASLCGSQPCPDQRCPVAQDLAAGSRQCPRLFFNGRSRTVDRRRNLAYKHFARPSRNPSSSNRSRTFYKPACSYGRAVQSRSSDRSWKRRASAMDLQRAEETPGSHLPVSRASFDRLRSQAIL